MCLCPETCTAAEQGGTRAPETAAEGHDAIFFLSATFTAHHKLRFKLKEKR